MKQIERQHPIFLEIYRSEIIVLKTSRIIPNFETLRKGKPRISPRESTENFCSLLQEA